MNSDSVKWLIAGLVGALLTLGVLGTGAFFAARFVLGEFTSEYDDDPVYGPDEWAEEKAEAEREEAEAQKRLEESGLSKRYTTVYIFDDTRYQLYGKRDYALVETRLKAKFDAARDPLALYRYSQLIDSLGDVEYDEDHAALLAILDDWNSSRPDSYYALLVRAHLAHEYAWYFRGSAYANQVPEEGWKNFRHYLNIARDDVVSAMALNPTDAECPALMAKITFLLDSDRTRYNQYVEQTLALNPHHMGVRYTQLNFSLPQWGGSERETQRVIADCDARAAEFPMLAEAKRQGLSFLDDEDNKSWNSPETKEMMYEAYLAQSKLNPDDLHVLGELASFAVHTRHFDTASDAMHRLGDRFPIGCKLGELPDYHRWRAISYAEHAQMEGVLGTPRESELLEEAVALAPEDSGVTGLYLGYLARKRDDALTRTYFTTCKDPYFATGAWGEPPNYPVMEAMAKAGRSDDWGFQGTDQERAMLDEAVALAPDNAYVRLVYAEHFITKREFDAAEEHLTKARELDPGYLPALHIMGWLHFHQKRWDAAIATANEFLATPPSPYLTRNTSDAKEIIDLCEKKKRGKS